MCLCDVQDTITLRCFFQGGDARIISLSWCHNDLYLVAGDTKGIIRKFNIRSGCCILEITHASSSKSIVWDLKYISPFIISADSLGRINIWNDQYGTLFQTFKEHTGDVLALAISSTNEVYSAGIDQRIVHIKQLANKNEWIKGEELKVHTHDIRALSLSSNGILASGGIDSQLIITDTKVFKTNNCLKCSQFQDSARFFSIANKANVIMHQGNDSVQLWQLYSKNNIAKDLPNGMPLHFLEIKNKDVHYILSSAIATDSTKVAVSTVQCFWLYDVVIHEPKVHCAHFSNLASYKMEFCHNNTLLILATIQEGIVLFDVVSFELIKMKNYFHHGPVTEFFCNKDGSLLTVKSNEEFFICDLLKQTFLYQIPKFNHNPLIMFHSDSVNLVIFSPYEIHSYNVLDRCCRKFRSREVGVLFPKGLELLGNFIAIYDERSLSLVKMQNTRDSFEFKQVFESEGILLFMSSFDNGEAVVVEQLWQDELTRLPPVLPKEHYGT